MGLKDEEREITRRVLEKYGKDSSWLADDAEPTGATFAESEPLPPVEPLPSKEEPNYSEVPESQPVAFQSSRPEDELVSRQPEMSPPPPPSEPAAPRPAPKRPAAPRAERQAASAPSLPPEPKDGEPITDEQLLSANAPRGVAPSAEGVEDKAYNPGMRTGQLRGEIAAGQDRSLQLNREAEGAIDSKQQARGEVEQIRSGYAAKDIEGRESRAAEQKQTLDSYKSRMEAELADLKQKMGNPPRDMVGMIFGIVSAVAAAGGKGEAAKAIQGLGQVVNRRMKTYQGEIEGGQKSLEGLGKLFDYERLQDRDEDDAAGDLNKAVAAEIDASLDYLEADTKDELQKNAIRTVRNEARQKALQGEMTLRQKAAAAARRREINARLTNAKTEEEREYIANAYGDEGREIRGQMQKMQKSDNEVARGMLEQDKLVADTQLAQAKATKEQAEVAGSGGPAGPIAGWHMTRELPAAAQTELVKVGRAKGTVQYHYGRLLQLAKEVESGKRSHLDANIQREAEDLRNAMVGLRTNMNGAGAPTGKEYDDTINTIANPQELFKRGSATASLTRAMANVEGAFGAGLRAINFVPESEMGQAGGARSGGGAVELVGPDGESMRLSPSAARALQKSTGGKWRPAGEASE